MVVSGENMSVRVAAGMFSRHDLHRAKWSRQVQKIALCTLSLSMGNIETRDDPYESVGIGEDHDISSEKWLNWGL